MPHYRFKGAGYDVPITNMLDIDGDATDDPEQATSIVAQLADGTWINVAKVKPSDIKSVE